MRRSVLVQFVDHVEDVGKTIREIKRVTRPGGVFLILVEVNHTPTACEPHSLQTGELLDALAPEFACERLAVYEPVETGMYQSILRDAKSDDPYSTARPGSLSARFTRLENDQLRS